jgi:hypothetical protein
MNKKNGKSILILCSSAASFLAIILLYQVSISHEDVIVKQSLGKSSNGETPNATKQSASQTAESLVRSIMDPSSLMSTVMNETAVGKAKKLSSISEAPSSTDGLIKSINPASKSKSENAVITSSSLSSLPTERGKSNNNSSSNTTLPAVGFNSFQNSSKNTVVRNVNTLFMAHQIIPPKDFIPLYDTSPYQILAGHLAAKIPCDANSKPSLQILIGHLPNLRPVEPQLIREYSQPGYICMYNVEIDAAKTTNVSAGNNNGSNGELPPKLIDTDIVLRNPTDTRILLPNTSTVVVGVDEVIPPGIEQAINGNSNSQPTTTTDNKNNIPTQESQGQISTLIRSMSELNK